MMDFVNISKDILADTELDMLQLKVYNVNVNPLPVPTSNR